MPTYEYSCDDCKKTFTVRERISDHEGGRKKGPRCPECGNRNTQQVFSSFFAKTSSKS